MPTSIQAPGASAWIVSERMPIATDFYLVCLWSTLGLLLTAAAFALGFGAELGQALAMAG